MDTQRRFNCRAFAALVVAFCGLGLPITGIANHAHGFDLLSVERHAWMSAHNVLGFLFVVFSIWHVWLNRRALWAHLRGGAVRLAHLSREATLALIVVAGFLALFVGHAFHAR